MWHLVVYNFLKLFFWTNVDIVQYLNVAIGISNV